MESVDAQDLGSLHHVAVESGLAPELASQMYPPSLATDGDVCLFVGRLDARPVASSLAIRSRKASGVYAVGTLADARRRGVGTEFAQPQEDGEFAPTASPIGHETPVPPRPQ